MKGDENPEVEQQVADEKTDAADTKAESAEKEAKPENGVEKKDNEEPAKEKAAVEEISPLERKIIRQVEYYFSDANLNRDKFLMEQITKNEDGWVPLSVLVTFKRLSELSKEPEVIINALVKSDEGLLEISDDHEKLRRHPERPILEYNKEIRKEISSRTAYAKGFPLTADMAELLEFFMPYDKVVNIVMRKYLDKPTKTYKFKGSVFATFEKKEQAQEFIEKDKIEYKERELIRKWQDKYSEEKKEELEKKQKAKKSKEPKEEAKTIELPRGTVLYFEGATEKVRREDLREEIEKVEGEWEVAYIDYALGQKKGHIRFHVENIASKFLEKLPEKKLKLADDVEISMRLLTLEEEDEYLKDAVEQMKNRRNRFGGNRKFGNRKRRFGGGHGNSKKKKVSSEDN